MIILDRRVRSCRAMVLEWEVNPGMGERYT